MRILYYKGDFMNDKKYIVYMHIFPNGKKYIGMTSKKPNYRWENGLAGYTEHKQKAMYDAIKEYGWENVEHIILYENLSYEEASEKEIQLIKEYKTNCHRYGDEYGYNMTDGGKGTKGHKCSLETIEKLRKETAKRKGKLCPNSKIVICDGVEYDSLIDFRTKNNVKGAVNAWLRGYKKMPIEWYNKKLHYKDLGFSVVRCQTVPHSYKIYYDGMTFESQAKFAEYIGITPSIVCIWIKGNCVPQHILDKGFKRL